MCLMFNFYNAKIGNYAVFAKDIYILMSVWRCWRWRLCFTLMDLVFMDLLFIQVWQSAVDILILHVGSWRDCAFFFFLNSWNLRYITSADLLCFLITKIIPLVLCIEMRLQIWEKANSISQHTVGGYVGI